MINFKLFGIDFQIRFLFVAVCTIFLLTDNTGTGIISLLACIIHELGHITTMIIVGKKPSKLVFEASGIRLVKSSGENKLLQDLIILLAGSATNIAIFLLFLPTMNSINNFSVTAAIHLMLGVLNLLPFEGLDGIEIARLILTSLFHPKTAYIIEKCLQIIFFAGIVIFCIFFLSLNGFNISLVILLIYVVVLTFISRVN